MGLEQDDFEGPFQSEPFYDLVSLMHPLLIIAEKETEKLECDIETSIAAPMILLTSVLKNIWGRFYCPNLNDPSSNEDR